MNNQTTATEYVIRVHTEQVNRPRGPFATAFDKGAIAAAAGDSRQDCPYQDKRTDRGSVTFSRAWRNAWLKGYDAVIEGRVDVSTEEVPA